MTSRPSRRTQPRGVAGGQAGSVSVLAPLLILTVLVLLGLAFDGGTAITAHQRAIGLAEQAARAGAQQVSLAWVRSPSGPYRLAPQAARQASNAYLGRAMTEITTPTKRPSSPSGGEALAPYGGVALTPQEVSRLGVPEEAVAVPGREGPADPGTVAAWMPTPAGTMAERDRRTGR